MSAFSHEDGLRKTGQGRSRKNRHSRRPRLTPQADHLESRRLLVYTALFSGVAFFQGDGADDTIIFQNINGQLSHNRFTAGDPGFNSDLDFDSNTPGDQTVAAGNGQSITVDMGAGSDVAIIGTDANPASTTGAQFSINGGTGATDQLIVDDSSGPRNATGSVTYSLDISSIIIADGASTAAVSYGGLTGARLELKAGSNNGLTRDFNSVQLGTNTTPIQILGGGSDVTDVFLFSQGQTFVGSLVGVVSQFNYGAYSSPASVNIGAATATGFSGSFSGVQTVIGGSGNDTLVGGNAISVLFNGQDGNDTITGGSVGDILIGGTGNDSIDGAGGDDFIDAGTGTDSVIGGPGTDTIGILNLSSNGGSAITIGGNNALVVNGSSANDGTVTFPGSDVEILNVDLVSSGIDSNDNLVVTTTLPVLIRVFGNEGDDTLDLSGFVGVSEIDGGPGADQLIGSVGSTTFLPGSGTDSVAITGGNGNDDIRIVRSSTLASIIRNGVTAPFDLDQTEGFTFDGGAGNDTLTFDISGGVPFPSGGFSYDGGVGGNDTLSLVGTLPIGLLGTVTYTPSTIVGSGNYDLDGRTIAFTNLEPINDTTSAANFVFNGPAGPLPYSLTNGPVLSGATTLQIASLGGPSFELVNLANKSNIEVNGASGGNTYQFDVPTSVSALSQFTLNAGDGNDSVVLRSTPAGGVFDFNLGLGDDTLIAFASGLGNNLVSTDGGLGGTDTLTFNTNGLAATGTTTTLTFNGRTLTYSEYEIINALILTVLNTSDAGFGSFRQAILNANATAGADTITFQIPNAGPFVLVPDTPYPSITETVTIDGYSQPGASPNTLAVGTNAVILIQIQGTSFNTPSQGAAGLTVDGVAAGGSVIRGLSIVLCEAGIDIINGAANVQILGNFLGVDTTGLIDLGNTEIGVFVGDSDNVVIGTLALADRNLISGNSLYGVAISASQFARVANNLIGTDRTGNVAISNDFAGVQIEAGSTGATIGGLASTQGNVISGNAADGIAIQTLTSVISNNLIGLTADGLTALGNRNGIRINGGSNSSISSNVVSGNTNDGILISGSTSSANTLFSNRIGTDSVGARAIPNGNYGVELVSSTRNNQLFSNVISGNTTAGVRLDGAGTRGNLIAQNRIGTNNSGSAAVPNGNGIEVSGSTDNTIGAFASSPGNIISGNTSDGIVFSNDAGRNVVLGNIIGLNGVGTAALPNAGNGITVISGTTAGQTIGGTTAATRNVISGNQGHGILYLFTNSTNLVGGDLIRGNYIGTNAAGTAAVGNGLSGVAIQTGRAVTIGGTASGAGNLISGNSESGIVTGGSSGVPLGGLISNILIQGNLVGTNAAGGSAIGNGNNGIELVEGTGVSVGGSAAGAGNLVSGNANQGLDLSVAALIQGNKFGTNISGTAAIPNGGNVILGTEGATIGGLTAGQGNLISGATGDGVRIVGSSSTGANRPTFILGNLIGTDGAGNRPIPNGGTGIFADGNVTATIRGNTVSANRGGGIQTANPSSVGVEAATTPILIAGNAIGTNTAGTARLGNIGPGILIRSSGVSIGGVSLGDRNVISANTGAGIIINGSRNLVQGNLIGTDSRGSASLGNGSFGVHLFESNSGNFTFLSTSNTLGGASAGAGNLISGNASGGLVLFDASTVGNVILGNRVGTNAAGNAALPNGGAGINIQGATRNTIGGIASGSANLISGNTGVGVQLLGPSNGLLGNRIGTTLDGNGALPNSAGIGVLVKGVAGNSIGGSVAGAGNLISGHVDSTGVGIGIKVEGTAANQSLRTVIQGNRIGTNAAGNAAIPNAVAGIYIVSAGGNTVGGSTAGARNVLSGNGSTRYPGAGLWIEDNASGNVAIGNYIGVSADGSTPLGNKGDGIVISDASNNVIGQGSAETRNVISANGLSGIQIFGADATGNVVRGNFIGTDAVGGGTAGRNGIFPFGNGSRNAANNGEVGVGVYLDHTTGNTIGGTSTADSNVISGNRTYGVQILSGSANTIAGNLVGTNGDGSAGVGNALDGILINGSANNTVSRNLISANGDSGIHLTAAASTGNSLVDNQIGVTASGTPLVNRRFGVVASDGTTGNTLTGGVIVANGGATNAIVDPSGNGITVNNVSASIVTMKRGKPTLLAVKIKQKKAKPVKAKAPFANRPQATLQKSHVAAKNRAR